MSTQPRRPNSFFSPFYILSAVVGTIIVLGLICLFLRACITRRRIQRRFHSLVQSGWLVPIFEQDEPGDNGAERNRENAIRALQAGEEPKMTELALDLNSIKSGDGSRAGSGVTAGQFVEDTRRRDGIWHDLKPLTLVSVPPTTLFTKGFINMLNHSSRFQQVFNLQSRVLGRASIPSASTNAPTSHEMDRKEKKHSSKKKLPVHPNKPKLLEVQLDALQVTFVVAMPSPRASQFFSMTMENSNKRISTLSQASTSTVLPPPVIIHPPSPINIDDLDLCLGTYRTSWDRSQFKDIPVPKTPPPTEPSSLFMSTISLPHLPQQELLYYPANTSLSLPLSSIGPRRLGLNSRPSFATAQTVNEYGDDDDRTRDGDTRSELVPMSSVGHGESVAGRSRSTIAFEGLSRAPSSLAPEGEQPGPRYWGRGGGGEAYGFGGRGPDSGTHLDVPR